MNLARFEEFCSISVDGRTYRPVDEQSNEIVCRMCMQNHKPLLAIFEEMRSSGLIFEQKDQYDA